MHQVCQNGLRVHRFSLHVGVFCSSYLSFEVLHQSLAFAENSALRFDQSSQPKNISCLSRVILYITSDKYMWQTYCMSPNSRIAEWILKKNVLNTKLDDQVIKTYQFWRVSTCRRGFCHFFSDRTQKQNKLINKNVNNKAT